MEVGVRFREAQGVVKEPGIGAAAGAVDGERHVIAQGQEASLPLPEGCKPSGSCQLVLKLITCTPPFTPL